MAGRDSVWLPSRSAYPFLFQANGHARSSAASRDEFAVRLTAILARLQGIVAVPCELRAGLHDMRPRDMIDLQSFLWVQGSDEYPD